MITSFKRVSVSLILIISLALSPLLITNTDIVHAAKQDDIANIAKEKKGKRSSHFKGFTPGAWCSDFVWWAADKADLMNGKTFPKNRVGGTNDIQKYFSKKGQYKKSTSSLKVQKGDLAIFGSSTHIGIVTDVKGKYVWVTHGNWSSKVCITKIKKTGYDSSSSAMIKGYVRLDYLASEPNIKVVFDDNGGETTKSYKKIKNTTKIGRLPEAEKEGYEFIGWYTRKNGGKKITTRTKFDVKKKVTVYAKYKVDENIDDFEEAEDIEDDETITSESAIQ